MFLLDTNVVSELRKAGHGRIDANVQRWSQSVDAAQLYISVLTLMELEIGILRVARRDPRQAALLRIWFDSKVLPEFSSRCLPVDITVALLCAGLHVPDP